MNKWYFEILLILIGVTVILLQIPFLNADADSNISDSRGPFSDEGLYTIQIRNYIHHGDLTFEEVDALIKTPLFSALLFLPFKIFGAKLIVGRLTIFLAALLVFLFVFSRYKEKSFAVIVFLILIMQFYIFHFFHFCLAEILSTSLILLAIYLISESATNISLYKSTILASLSLFLAYLLKIQYAYTIVIIPLILVVFVLINPSRFKILSKQMMIYIVSCFAFLTLYYLLWYLPNKEFYEYAVVGQSSGRFLERDKILDYADFLLHHIFYNSYLKWYSYIFYLMTAIGVLMLFLNKKDRFRYFFAALICWLLIELHKLAILHVPIRYLISLFVPMLMIISLVANELLKIKAAKYIKYPIFTVVCMIIIFFSYKNLNHYFSSVDRRTYRIADINKYLSGFNFENKPVMGAWGPALTWKSNALSLPVWKDRFNDQDVIKSYNPAVIITEVDEEDSNQAFLSKGIDLNLAADSTRIFTINKWQVKIYWMKQSSIQE